MRLAELLFYNPERRNTDAFACPLAKDRARQANVTSPHRYTHRQATARRSALTYHIDFVGVEPHYGQHGRRHKR